MPKLQVVSGSSIVKLLTKLGYQVMRQRGSHVRLRKMTKSGEHNITVSMHDEIAKGTLNDITSKASNWNGISKDKLLDALKPETKSTIPSIGKMFQGGCGRNMILINVKEREL